MLPEGEPVRGVTSLGKELFVLREKACDQVEVYENFYYRPLRRLTVPNCRGLTDVTSCEHYCCVYIGDGGIECIHRLDEHRAFTQWAVNDKPAGLSVNVAHNVLVTCPAVRKIKEFSSHGDLLRELTLDDDIINPSHAIQIRNDEIIVCYGSADDAVHRVCKIFCFSMGHTCSAGADVEMKTYSRYSHGGQRGSGIGQYNMPRHLAVDNNEFVFVADFYNRRVTLLSPKLDYIRPVVSPDDLKWRPDRLCLDIELQRLYVADNEWKDGKLTAGRVVVFSV